MLTLIRNLGSLLLLTALLSACTHTGHASANHGSGGKAAALHFTQAAYRYVCDNQQVIRATYVSTGTTSKGLLSFVVLEYKQRIYGLAQAVSADGGRYLGHVGLSLGTGLQWWAKGHKAWLGQFKGDDATHTKRLLSCHVAES